MRIVNSQGWTIVRDDGTEAPLDALPRPALVTTSEGRVVAVNAAFAALARRDARDLEGSFTGVAMACKRSRLPEGCGRTMHCRDCTIRRMVAEVSRTHLARWRVPAYVETGAGRVEMCITVRPAAGEAGEDGRDLVLVVVDDAPCEPCAGG